MGRERRAMMSFASSFEGNLGERAKLITLL